jgi:hydrogenase expression/formation protein HypD
MSAARAGLSSLLSSDVRLISGPGCPVCVTAQSEIDRLISAAELPGVTLCTYGDMLRVPSRRGSLEQARAGGADIRVIYSTLDAVRWAEADPTRQFVLAGIGFETTAPATAAAVLTAERRELDNFTVLASHKRVVPAMEALLADGKASLDGFLCPGHVSIILGAEAYRPIVEQYGIHCVVGGFEPLQMLSGLARLIDLCPSDPPTLVNDYPEAVSPEGNRVARRLIDQVLEPVDAPWRGLGTIPASGLALRPAYERFDASHRFELSIGPEREHSGCRCGEVLQGTVTPPECRLFGRACTPLHPLGPCMVSSEGTCAAWFKYRRHERPTALEVLP